MDEAALIEKAKSGDKFALNTLLTENYEILKGYSIKMTGNPYKAQDIIQETMLKAILKLDKFVPKAKFSTWLIKIATNIYRDDLRKNKFLSLDPPDTYDEKSTENPEDESIRNLEYKEVMEVLQTLPYQKRACFILKHYYGYEYEEIAKILSCPVGTVRSRLHYAIRHITSELEKRRMI